MNRVELTAELTGIQPLRHTPAGIPVLQFGLRHESRVLEAGSLRQVTLELQAVALGEPAQALSGADVGSQLQVGGFLAPRQRGSSQVVLHVQQVRRIESTNRPGIVPETDKGN